MVKECYQCDGKGEIEVRDGNHTHMYECYVCDGTGELTLEDVNEIANDIEWATCECGGDVAEVQTGKDIVICCRDCDNHTLVL